MFSTFRTLLPQLLAPNKALPTLPTTGVSIEASNRRSAAAEKTSYRRLLSLRAGTCVWVSPNGTAAYYIMGSRLEKKVDETSTVLYNIGLKTDNKSYTGMFLALRVSYANHGSLKPTRSKRSTKHFSALQQHWPLCLESLLVSLPLWHQPPRPRRRQSGHESWRYAVAWFEAYMETLRCVWTLLASFVLDPGERHWKTLSSNCRA